MKRKEPFGGVGKPQKRTVPQPQGNPAGKAGTPDFMIGGKPLVS